MSDSSRSEERVAFIVAAIVLLALPLLVMFGLAVIALATRAGSRGETDWIVWTIFAVWVVLVVAAGIVFAVRFIRRARGAKAM